jgi:rhodanese-related sulfurtransferase
MLPLEISPQEVKRRVDAGDSLELIDCREPHEYQLARIEGAMLIPLRGIAAELAALEARARQSTLVVYCHHGIRSMRAVEWLREQGIETCQSMSGGIDAWSLAVDPSVPRYS